MFTKGAGIAQSVERLPTGGRPRSRSSRPGRVKNYLHVVQTGSGAHPASYPVGTGGASPGVKRPGSEADHSPPSSAGVKNGGAIPHSPIRFHGLALNKLCTGITLPLTCL
jgi:hypothetical protein